MSKKLRPHYTAAGDPGIIWEVIMKISASKIAIFLAAAFGLSLLTIVRVEAQGSGYPTTAINMKEFSFTPSIVDSTSSSQAVAITIRVTGTERDFCSDAIRRQT